MMKLQLSRWSWLECAAPGGIVSMHSSVWNFGHPPFMITKAIFSDLTWEFQLNNGAVTTRGWSGSFEESRAIELLDFLAACRFKGTIETQVQRPENKAALIFGPRAARL